MKTKIKHICSKELSTFFFSPVAFIFLGVFLAVNLFIFFWVETFFARNIADVRPLFEWMPVLLIFLVSALTMKMWSEEQRMGTLELVRTLPVKTFELVLGKFSACMVLVVIALALTLPVPLTVSGMGELDWGPIVGAYVAAVFLAGAYTSVGLYVSSRTDSQIVSLLVTMLISTVLYLIGSDTLASFFGNQAAEAFRLIGTGSRFESITRGVIDFRDIYFYVSVIGVFLSLNVFSLEKRKWSLESKNKKPSHRRLRLITWLFSLNFIAANFWLFPIETLRADITKEQLYSISPATKSILGRLDEPLLIRGYFSEKTHPLLAPLVPRLRDLIREYAVAGRGKVRAEFIDPRENPELEQEASSKFNIKPVPFPIADKYQTSVVNSYFDVLIRYGDRFEVLSYQDLIEVKLKGETDLEVQLRNPEYDITRAIKKTLYGFQSVESLLATLKKPVTFQGYISAKDKLPEPYQVFVDELSAALGELKDIAGDKLVIDIKDPEAGEGSLAKEIEENYGFSPMIADLLNPVPFYFYLTLAGEKEVIRLGLPEELDKQSAKRVIEAGLKRFSPGFLRTLGLVAPENPPTQPWMQQQMGGKQFQFLQEKLSESYLVEPVDLKQGFVPEEIDLLLIVSPQDLTDKELFSLDQFLMKGGTVILSTSAFSITQTPQSIAATEHNSGLEEWLKNHGISIDKKLILDPQNENYPVPVQRNLGPIVVTDIQMIPYPFFVDVRGEGINEEMGITSGISQTTLNWPSPLEIDQKENALRRVHVLLRSSPESWTTESTNIEPNLELYPELGFPKGKEPKAHTVAALVEGEFESFFKGKQSPLLEKPEEEQAADKTSTEGEEVEKEKKTVISSVIEKSPDSARLIIFSSNEFLTDQTLGISASIGSSRYLNSLQLVENSADWSLEDRALLSIRSRAQFGRTLDPMDTDKQRLWEYANYALALIGLLIVYGIYRARMASESKRHQELLGE